MAKLIIATLLSLLASAQGANIDEACSGSGQGDCIADALCTLVGSSTVCKCDTGFTAIADKSACKKNAGQSCAADAECITDKCDTTCTTLIDGACTGTDQSTCPVGATCTSSVCKCNTGYTANTAKSACDKNGAAGVTASLVLMAAAFLASRFF